MRLNRKILLVGAGLVASLAVYLGMVAGFIGVPGALPSMFWDRVFPALCLCGALAIDLSVAVSWHRSTGLSLRSAFLYVSLAVLAGSVLISLAVMRENWLEVMKESLRRT